MTKKGYNAVGVEQNTLTTLLFLGSTLSGLLTYAYIVRVGYARSFRKSYAFAHSYARLSKLKPFGLHKVI
jgi:hypothetical protein